MSATPGRVYVKSTYRIVARYQDYSGTYLNPDSVSLLVTNPNGTTSTYVYGTDDEIERSATGIYNGDIYVSELSGRWFWRWEASNGSGDATVYAPTEGSFVVQSSPHYDGSPSDYGR